MASKDYDDLLESFMNNSQKVYNEDKKTNSASNNLPTSYSVSSKEKSQKARRARKDENKNSKSGKKNVLDSKFVKVLVGFAMICCVVAIVCLSVISIYGYSVVHGDPVFDLTEEKYSQNQTSFIYGYDQDDKLVEITRLHGEENRIWVSSDDMSSYLPAAFVAAEDERFESHNGVDWKRTIGVTVTMSGEGGSTITQQLIKNLTDQNDVTFVRKFNEILSALNLEKHYEKGEILEAYLNTVYLSHGCYGVKTASEYYFGKEVSELNIAESAVIAGITKAPTRYDPLNEEGHYKTRQKWILGKMLELEFITQEEYDEAVAYELIFTNSENYQGSQVEEDANVEQDKEVNSYYTDYVITEVMNDLQKMGYSAKKAKELVYGGGLKIYSAIDFTVQESLEDVYVNYRRMPDETVQGACVVMNYEGRVLGLVGGTGEKTADLTLNRATKSERQPGSTIKPLSVYGPAIEKSLQDDNTNIYWSTPTPDKPLMKVEGKMWPTNEGGSYSSSNVSIQRGLAKSLNTISARTLDEIGVEYSFDFITNKFHLSTLDSVIDCDYAPLATGSLTTGATVLEMTAAYAAFGNGGYYYEPYCYYKIEDSQGNVIIEKDPEKTKESAMSESSAWLMNKLLQTVMTQGTGSSYKVSGVECIGKTGTTTGSKDRWFMGGTPEYIAGVWYGYDIPKEIRYSLSGNPSGTIWNLVMKNIYEETGKDVTKFEKCDELVNRQYCAGCGKLRSGTGYYGWFDENNMPGYCSEDHEGLYDWDTTESTTEEESTTKKGETTSAGASTTESSNDTSTTQATTHSTTKASEE